MYFSSFPVLKILIPLLFGILFAHYCYLSLFFCRFLFFSIFIFLPIAVVIYHFSSYKYQWIAAIFLQLCFVFVGIITTMNILYPYNRDKNEQIFKEQQDFIAVVDKISINKEKYFKCIAKIENNKDGIKVNEKVLLYLYRNDTNIKLHIGDLVLIKTEFVEIENANKYAFDYKMFMLKKGVKFSSFVRKNNWKILTNTGRNIIKQKSAQLQQFLAKQFANSGMTGDEYSVMSAILLGNDETMDPTLRTSYASAGVSHILCVSGMHLGILFMILDFLLKALDYNKTGRIIKSILLLLFIWTYSAITGLSPSVLRASTMFTFVVIGKLINRNVTIYHSLFTSIFILLAINPIFIFDLGFQLSYLAVFGIVVIQKPMYHIYVPDNKVINYFWELITVSISAQIATAPLAIYVFGQFPNYFLIANIAVIIISFIVVVSGITVLVSSFSVILSVFFSKITVIEIKIMNNIIKYIENLPGAVSRHLYLSTEQALLLYILLIFIILFIMKRKKIYYRIFLSVISLFCLLKICEIVDCKNEISVTEYNTINNIAINFNYHGTSVLLNNFIENKKNSTYTFSIEPHERIRKINSALLNINSDTICKNIKFAKKGNCIIFNDQKYYISSEKKLVYISK